MESQVISTTKIYNKIYLRGDLEHNPNGFSLKCSRDCITFSTIKKEELGVNDLLVEEGIKLSDVEIITNGVEINVPPGSTKTAVVSISWPYVYLFQGYILAHA